MVILILEPTDLDFDSKHCKKGPKHFQNKNYLNLKIFQHNKVRLGIKNKLLLIREKVFLQLSILKVLLERVTDTSFLTEISGRVRTK